MVIFTALSRALLAISEYRRKFNGNKKTRPLWNRVLWSISDSNRPPIDCEPIALPDELIPQVKTIIAHFLFFVQVGGDAFLLEIVRRFSIY